MLPAIFGLSGPVLTDDERGFVRDAVPAGFILFGRNIVDPEQLRRLTDDLRAVTGRTGLPILVDQEGGRVARLGPPHWPKIPAPWRFAELYKKAPISALEAARVNAEAMAAILVEVGINVDCTPLLDLRDDQTHDAIGDRTLGREPMQVASLGRAVLRGLEAGGVIGVVKHMPGHGRARVDSHEILPVADAEDRALEADIAPFRSLNDAAIGMVAHLLYPAWDGERPASLSPVVIGEVIRGRIGFDGLLLSDDLAMGALTGRPGERARASIEAGCDLALYCSGKLEDAIEVASGLGSISEAGKDRLIAALSRIEGTTPCKDLESLIEKRDSLLAYA